VSTREDNVLYTFTQIIPFRGRMECAFGFQPPFS
jgi:hypothetical protein